MKDVLALLGLICIAPFAIVAIIALWLLFIAVFAISLKIIFIVGGVLAVLIVIGLILRHLIIAYDETRSPEPS